MPPRTRGRRNDGDTGCHTRRTRLWRVVEPYHAVVYFAPETREEYGAAGLKGWWMGYFASRSAPMGAVGSETVLATFHNFAPSMVRRAIPDAWRFSSPERVLEARLRVADMALRRLLGEAVASDEVAEAADLAGRAAAAGLARSPTRGGASRTPSRSVRTTSPSPCTTPLALRGRPGSTPSSRRCATRSWPPAASPR